MSGEREMQEGIAQQEVCRERIRVLDAKRVEEIDRICVIDNAGQKAMYAAHAKAACSAEMSSCPPCGLSLPPNSADSVVDVIQSLRFKPQAPAVATVEAS